MELRVSPTRMQLLRLKKRLAMARRGHKLLKDKRDELMRRFMELVERNKKLREDVETHLSSALKDLLMARMTMSATSVEQAIMVPKESFRLSASEGNIMSVRVPRFRWSREGDAAPGDIYPYGLAMTSTDLDTGINSLSRVIPELLELAEVEKSAELLADEIERTRRRVNALEYVLIPKLTETVDYITMKLDEAERGNLTRLMKIKDMVRQRGA